MSKITVCLSYYNQVEVLKQQVLSWLVFPRNIVKQYTFFIMDDCSKIPAEEVLKNINTSRLDLHIYRVEEDLYCNIAGVRNLGAMECETEWMIILDMDTFIPPVMSAQLLQLTQNNKSRVAYKFNRDISNDSSMLQKNPSGFKPHPAVCLIRKTDYWDIGGCEEDLVGNYGMTDPSFWYKAKDKVKIEIKENLYLKHKEEGAADIVRDTSVNRRLIVEKKKNNSWSTDYIRFKWRKVNTYIDANNIKLF